MEQIVVYRLLLFIYLGVGNCRLTGLNVSLTSNSTSTQLYVNCLPAIVENQIPMKT